MKFYAVCTRLFAITRPLGTAPSLIRTGKHSIGGQASIPCPMIMLCTDGEGRTEALNLVVPAPPRQRDAEKETLNHEPQRRPRLLRNALEVTPARPPTAMTARQRQDRRTSWSHRQETWPRHNLCAVVAGAMPTRTSKCDQSPPSAALTTVATPPPNPPTDQTRPTHARDSEASSGEPTLATGAGILQHLARCPGS